MAITMTKTQHSTCFVEKIAMAEKSGKVLARSVSLSAMKWGRGLGRGGAQGSRGKGFYRAHSTPGIQWMGIGRRLGYSTCFDYYHV